MKKSLPGISKRYAINPSAPGINALTDEEELSL